MNLSKIRTLCSSRNGGLKKLASEIGMTEANLHRRINANDIKVSSLELIADRLGVPVAYFFDQESTVVREAGRDYVEKGKIEHKGPEYNGASGGTMSDLEKENAELKSKLIAAQAQIIDLLNKK